MTALKKLTIIEARLLRRDLGTGLVAVVLPTLLLVVLGAIPALRRPDTVFGGQRFIDIFCPSLVVITIAVLGLNGLPIRLATYREKGVLRRMSTTPVHPANLLAAQLLVNLAALAVSVALLLAVGNLGFDVPLPRHRLGFIAAFGFGAAALFSIGLLVAAIAPTARAGAGIAVPMYLLAMFFGGVYLPRFLLPDLLVRIGAYTPPGVQAIQDAWIGAGPNPLQLGVMAGTAVVAGTVAAKMFRWE
jgi:ABC-2 type transport system permease protein